MNASCRLSIEKPTQLDYLLAAAWRAAEDVFVDPTDDGAKAELRRANEAVAAYRSATNQ